MKAAILDGYNKNGREIEIRDIPVPEIFTEKQIHASVDGVFSLDDVNAALQKVAAGGSKGKTIIRI